MAGRTRDSPAGSRESWTGNGSLSSSLGTRPGIRSRSSRRTSVQTGVFERYSASPSLIRPKHWLTRSHGSGSTAPNTIRINSKSRKLPIEAPRALDNTRHEGATPALSVDALCRRESPARRALRLISGDRLARRGYLHGEDGPV